MRRILWALLVAFVWAGLQSTADAGHGHWHRGRHGGHWHRYGGWGGVSLSVGYPAYGFGFGSGAYAPAYCPPSYCPPPYCPPIAGGWHGYSGLTFAIGPAYGVRYAPRSNYVEYFLDSSYEPAELAFGPLAVKQFLGLDRNFAMGPLTEPAAPLPLVVAKADRAAADKADKVVRLKVRSSNAESRRRAERYLALGDQLFEKHQWHSALQKYKLAAQLAPDVAECYWRQGHALIAVNQFGQAADAFRRALRLDADTSRGGFRLNDLYVDSEAAKSSHLEALAGEALAATIDPDAFFLIGVLLHYDGETERARKFFERAADLSGDDAGLVAAFLAPKPAPGLPALSVPVKAGDLEI